MIDDSLEKLRKKILDNILTDAEKAKLMIAFAAGKISKDGSVSGIEDNACQTVVAWAKQVRFQNEVLNHVLNGTLIIKDCNRINDTDADVKISSAAKNLTKEQLEILHKGLKDLDDVDTAVTKSSCSNEIRAKRVSAANNYQNN